MPTQNFGYRPTHIGFRLSGWRAALALALVFAVIAAVIIFAFTLTLVLAPVLIVGSVLYYFFLGNKRNSVATEKSDRSEIIEGEFRIVKDSEHHENHIETVPIQIASRPHPKH